MDSLERKLEFPSGNKGMLSYVSFSQKSSAVTIARELASPEQRDASTFALTSSDVGLHHNSISRTQNKNIRLEK